MKKKLLLLPLMMLVLSSCSLFGGSSTDPSNSGPTNTDPSDTGSDSSDPSDTGSTSSNPTDPDNVVEYTVSFDLNYPNAVGAPAPQVVQKNQLVTKPTDPTRDDYTFLYWSEGMYSTVAWGFANTGVTRNMTLYAAWEYNDVDPEPVTKTYYVRAPEYWLEDNHTVALYAWIDGTDDNNLTWPGDKMTHVDGRIYSYEVDEKFTHIVFARVTATGEEPALEAKAQTIDLPIANLSNPDFDFYWINEDVRYGENKCQGLWAVYPNEPDTPTPPGPGSLYYVEIPTWWDFDGAVAGIHMWDANNNSPVGWPGQIMDHVHDRIYSFEIPDEYDNFLFARVNPNLSEWATAENEGYWNAKTINLSKDDAGTHNLFTINEAPQTWGDPGCEGVWSTYTA